MILEDIIADFEVLDDWEDRYRYVIELGRGLELLPDSARSPENKVRGCVSQVWLETQMDRTRQSEPVMTFVGDSDAQIVRGLIAILFAIYSGKTAQEVMAIDPEPILEQLGLREHITPQRSNGLSSMIGRIRSDAQNALGDPIRVH